MAHLLHLFINFEKFLKILHSLLIYRELKFQMFVY